MGEKEEDLEEYTAGGEQGKEQRGNLRNHV